MAPSALPALRWGCRDTGCEVFCEPPEGSIVAVHLRAGDAGIDNPAAASSYVVQEVCSP